MNLPYFLIIFTFFLIGCNSNNKELTKIKIEDENFWIEIADTSEKRQLGLMNRKKLKKNHGMLFVFESIGIYPFWMKNTLIPLRMIWIDDHKKVVDIQEALPCEKSPCKIYTPINKAKFVLEVNLNELPNLKTGMKINF